MSDQQQSEESNQNRRRRYWRIAAAGVALVFLAGLIVLFYTVDVCDNQMAQNSSTVKVCRHLQVTDPPAAVVGLVAIALLGAVFGEISAVDVAERLHSSDRGERLTAYAYLVSRPPAPDHLAELINALVREDKPYGEYRAALAAARLTDIYPKELTPELCRLLQDRLRRLPAGVDRAAVLRGILRHCR